MKMPHSRLLILAATLCMLPVAAQDIPEFTEEAVDTAFDGIPEGMAQEDPERRPGEVPAMFRDDAMLDDSHFCTDFRSPKRRSRIGGKIRVTRSASEYYYSAFTEMTHSLS